MPPQLLPQILVLLMYQLFSKTIAKMLCSLSAFMQHVWYCPRMTGSMALVRPPAQHSGCQHIVCVFDVSVMLDFLVRPNACLLNLSALCTVYCATVLLLFISSKA